MYCVKCGNKLEDTDKYCTKCGNRAFTSTEEQTESARPVEERREELQNAPQPEVYGEGYAPHQAWQYPPKRSSGIKIAIISVAVLLLLSVIAVGVILALRGGSGASTPERAVEGYFSALDDKNIDKMIRLSYMNKKVCEVILEDYLYDEEYIRRSYKNRLESYSLHNYSVNVQKTEMYDQHDFIGYNDFNFENCQGFADVYVEIFANDSSYETRIPCIMINKRWYVVDYIY
jgi:uncharacterized membrane protein YvbJ